MNILASQFGENKANSNGGAVCIEDLEYDDRDVGGDVDRSITVNVSMGVFSSNEANGSGGALYVSSHRYNR